MSIYGLTIDEHIKALRKENAERPEEERSDDETLLTVAFTKAGWKPIKMGLWERPKS